MKKDIRYEKPILKNLDVVGKGSDGGGCGPGSAAAGACGSGTGPAGGCSTGNGWPF